MARWVIGFARVQGIPSRIVVESLGRSVGPGTEIRVIAEPTSEGKRTDAYQRERETLGDEWTFDLTESWSMPGELPESIQRAIARVEDELRGRTA